jgi:CBS domain-containing protein
MYVHTILNDARRRLALLPRAASLIDAAGILANANTPLAIVCDDHGVAVGVVSRMDVVKQLGRVREEIFATTVGSVMTSSFLGCRENQTLQSVWNSLSSRNLRCLPVLDESDRPLGVLHARDLVRALLEEVTHEEILLRDYVMGVGYR